MWTLLTSSNYPSFIFARSCKDARQNYIDHCRSSTRIYTYMRFVRLRSRNPVANISIAPTPATVDSWIAFALWYFHAKQTSVTLERIRLYTCGNDVRGRSDRRTCGGSDSVFHLGVQKSSRRIRSVAFPHRDIDAAGRVCPEPSGLFHSNNSQHMVSNCSQRTDQRHTNHDSASRVGRFANFAAVEHGTMHVLHSKRWRQRAGRKPFRPRTGRLRHLV
jgi:hypothetical protein